MHCCISFRYDRYEGCPVEAETEDGEWWTRLEDGWMDPDVHDPKEGTCQASII